MTRAPFAYVRIDQSKPRRLAALTLALVLGFAGGVVSRAQSGDAADPHAHHHGAAAAPPATQPPTAAPPAGGSVPSRSATISTPSWFAGGEGLYVPYYFDTFQGLDLTSLTASQKERFLHRVNTEFCSCNQTGCRRDTIAHCYVTDTACPRAPVRIREILEKVKAGDSEGTAPAPPSVTVTPRP